MDRNFYVFKRPGGHGDMQIKLVIVDPIDVARDDWTIEPEWVPKALHGMANKVDKMLDGYDDMDWVATKAGVLRAWAHFWRRYAASLETTTQ